jgi:hypothetical protein
LEARETAKDVGHCAGIGHVIRDVGSAIDPRHDQVRPPLQKVSDRQIHTIGGRSRHSKDVFLELFITKGLGNRKSMTDSTHLTVGSDDRHLADRAQSLDKGTESRRVDAIVVGHQDADHSSPSWNGLECARRAR